MADPSHINAEVGSAAELESSEQVVAQALAYLPIKSDEQRSEAQVRLTQIGEDYRTGILGSRQSRTAAAEKKAIGKAARHLGKALDELQHLAPEYLVALDAVVGDLNDSTDAVIDDVVRAYLATSKFVDTFKPVDGRSPDLPLREAVLALTFLFQELGLEPPGVRMNKNNERSPELASPTALAIGALLRGINPRLSETAVVNMVESVLTNPDKEDDLGRLIALHSALDLSLHPGRRDPAVRREFFWNDWERARENASSRITKSAKNS